MLYHRMASKENLSVAIGYAKKKNTFSFIVIHHIQMDINKHTGKQL